MALKKAVEDRLAQIQNEEYRKVMREVYEANPDLQEAYMAKQEISRQFDHNAAVQKKQEAWWAQHGEEAWGKVNTDLATAKSSLAAAEQRAHELESSVASGANTGVEDNAMLKELAGVKGTIAALKTTIETGVITPDTLNKTITEKGQGLVDFMTHNNLDTLMALRRYERDFPGQMMEKKDILDLYALAGQKGVELDDAYHLKYGAQVEEAKLAKIKTDHEAALKAAEEKFRATTSTLPVSASPQPESGPMAGFLKRAADQANNGNNFANVNDAAMAAGAALRTEGKT